MRVLSARFQDRNKANFRDLAITGCWQVVDKETSAGVAEHVEAVLGIVSDLSANLTVRHAIATFASCSAMDHVSTLGKEELRSITNDCIDVIQMDSIQQVPQDLVGYW